MHVSLVAEKIFDLGPLPVTNALLTTWLVLVLITLFAIIFRLRLKKQPRGIQNIVEAIVGGFENLIDSVTGSLKQTRKFFPFIVTIFLFVLLNNWAGLIPGVGAVGIFHETEVTAETSATPEEHLAEASTEPATHAEESTENAEHSSEHGPKFTPIFRAGTADLSFTLALAFIAVILVQIMGVTTLGAWHYFSRFINFKNPIHFFVGILEIVSEFSKMISFSFRLFGNVFAGEVLLTVIISLAPYVIPMPFYGLEIFVGAIQALVFAALTLVFFKMATVSEH
jgi:F-type H+-transporting ATPase subunit a